MMIELGALELEFLSADPRSSLLNTIRLIGDGLSRNDAIETTDYADGHGLFGGRTSNQNNFHQAPFGAFD